MVGAVNSQEFAYLSQQLRFLRNDMRALAMAVNENKSFVEQELSTLRGDLARYLAEQERLKKKRINLLARCKRSLCSWRRYGRSSPGYPSPRREGRRKQLTRRDWKKQNGSS